MIISQKDDTLSFLLLLPPSLLSLTFYSYYLFWNLESFFFWKPHDLNVHIFFLWRLNLLCTCCYCPLWICDWHVSSSWGSYTRSKPKSGLSVLACIIVNSNGHYIVIQSFKNILSLYTKNPRSFVIFPHHSDVFLEDYRSWKISWSINRGRSI